jgi:hypothetical protein
MTKTALLIALLVLPAAVPAQAFVRVGAGMTVSTPFVKDFIAEPIESRQSFAPTAAALVGWRHASGHRIGVEARYATGSWEVEDRGLTDDLGGLATIGLALFADGPLRGALRWEAVAGTIAYRPESETGLFSGGAPTPWMVGAGLSWSRAMGQLVLVPSLRYDYHGFSTSRLDGDDYTARQAVHRIGLSLSIERGF